MKKLAGIILLLLLTVSSIHRVHAQATEQEEEKYQITGRILEKESGEPIPYATITLVDAQNDKTIAGAVADVEGKFVITGFKNGSFIVKPAFMGYSSATVHAVEVTDRKKAINIGDLAMNEDVVNLQEVTVMGQRTLIEEKVDRTVYNAEYDKTTVGGSATDVLRRVPMLSVDMDGNVSMRGSSNILVLIDGKQSAIVASNVSDALKQIPAEEIKSVEVITSPSAKYDAEGTGGVINIITHKNNLQGASLNVNSSFGLRASNLGLNASLKKGKMGWTLGGFGRKGYNIYGAFDNEQILSNPDGSNTTILQSADTRNDNLFGRYNFGWDYDINKYNFLTASVSVGFRNMKSQQENLLTEIFIEDNLSDASLRNVQMEDLSNNVDVNLNYTKTFDKKLKEFSISGLYSVNNRNNDFINSLYTESFEEVMSRLKNENRAVNEEFTIQLDNVTPLGSGTNQILEYGAKNIVRKAVSDFGYFSANGATGDFEEIDNVALNNEFSYDQNVTSGYVSYMLSFWENYTIKSGLRYEYTHIDADFKNSELPAEIPAYGLFVPSVNLSRKLANGNMVKAAYNRRVQRPSLHFLNPNINSANPQQISQGNPLLDPELTDNYELSYSTFVKGSSFNLTSFFRNTSGSIQPVRTIQEDGVIFTNYENVGHERAIGLSIFTNLNVSGKLSLNGSIDGYYAMLNNGLEDPLFAASNEGFVLSGRLFGSYSLPKNWQLQLFSFARGRQVQLQGSSGGFAMYNLNLNKQFNEKRGSIGFGVENFLTREFKIRNEIVTPTIAQQSTNVLRNMSFRVNFSYRIGSLSTDGPRKKKRGVKNEDLKEGSSGANDAVGN